MAHNENASPGQRRLSQAELRRASPLKLYGGRSAGAVCDYCRVVIPTNDPEYEVDAELDATKLALHFHVACYDAWRTASAEPGAPEEPGARDTAA